METRKRHINFLSTSVRFVKRDFGFPKNYGNMHLFTQGKISTLVQTRQSYNSLRAMKQHAKTHLNIEHKCDVCSRTFKDQAYLRQHRRGTHGREWMAVWGCGGLATKVAQAPKKM